MTVKHSPARINAFLSSLAQTGNQTLAAERAKVSRSWVCKWRALDAGFDAACRDAIETAGRHFDRLSASEEGVGSKPPVKWAYLNGAELVVRATGGTPPACPDTARRRGRPQIARARLHGWSPRVEERFLIALTATCNVKAACAEVGLTPASAYDHRLRWPEFARRWDLAIMIGYDQLECGLIEAGCNLFSGEMPPEPAPLRGMTVSQAIHLLHMHKHAQRGLGKRPGRWAREPDIEEVRADVIHRLEVFRRVALARGEVSG